MSKIQEYFSTAALRGHEPTGQGANAVANAGRRISAMAAEDANRVSRAASVGASATRSLASGVAEIGQGITKYEEHRDVMRMHAGAAELTNQMTHAWNAVRTDADVNDPAVAEKFNTDVLGPALDKFAQDFGTRRGQEMAASFGQNLREHLFVRQAADAATAAGAAVADNLHTVDANNAATLTADPTSLEFINAQTRTLIDNYKRSNPNLTAEQAAHIDELGRNMTRNNTIAAFHGIAEKDPAHARSLLESGYGSDALNASERAALGSYVRTQENIRKEQERADQVEQRRQYNDAANAEANKIFAGAINPDTGTLNVGPAFFQSVKELANKFPKEETGLARSLFNAGKTAVAEELSRKFQQTDPDTAQDIIARVSLPPGDPRAITPAEIDMAYTEGRLSKHDFTDFRRMSLDVQRDPVKREALSQFNKFIAATKSSITRSSLMLGKFAQEDQRFGQYQRDMYTQFEQAYQRGDWRDLLDATNPKYLGKQIPLYGYNTKEGLAAYQQNLQNGVGIATPVINPAVHPGAVRQPGETPEEFLRRKAGQNAQ